MKTIGIVVKADSMVSRKADELQGWLAAISWPLLLLASFAVEADQAAAAL